VPDLLQTGDLIAVVPSRLVRGYDKRLKLFRPPVDVAPFDVIAVCTRGPTRMARIAGCARAWWKRPERRKKLSGPKALVAVRQAGPWRIRKFSQKRSGAGSPVGCRYRGTVHAMKSSSP
jgi:hypothetical protein